MAVRATIAAMRPRFSVFIAASEALTMAVTAPGWAPLVSFTLLILILLLRPEL